MATPLRMQYALMCLQELDRHGPGFLDARKISRDGGIPADDCREILARLHDAGLLEVGTKESFALRQPLESLTVLQIIEAITAPQPSKAPAFRLLTTPGSGALRKTLQAVRAASLDRLAAVARNN
jgi:DNA-binding IscR family transcriptional regulator